jgi:hypothetical protein
MTNTLQMSEIGRALASANGAIVQKQLDDVLTVEMKKAQLAARQGLSKQGFEDHGVRVRALESAKLIVKSIALYHSA